MRKLLSLLSFIFFLIPTPALAFSVGDTGLSEAGRSVYSNTASMDAGTFVGTYLMIPLFSIAGVIFLVLIVYAGILWMTDRGDMDYVKKAKNILVHSTIGIIILISAYAITTFVLSGLTSPPTP